MNTCTGILIRDLCSRSVLKLLPYMHCVFFKENSNFSNSRRVSTKQSLLPASTRLIRDFCPMSYAKSQSALHKAATRTRRLQAKSEKTKKTKTRTKTCVWNNKSLQRRISAQQCSLLLLKSPPTIPIASTSQLKITPLLLNKLPNIPSNSPIMLSIPFLSASYKPFMAGWSCGCASALVLWMMASMSLTSSASNQARRLASCHS
jgi:hypothetical protein